MRTSLALGLAAASLTGGLYLGRWSAGDVTTEAKTEDTARVAGTLKTEGTSSAAAVATSSAGAAAAAGRKATRTTKWRRTIAPVPDGGCAEEGESTEDVAEVTRSSSSALSSSALTLAMHRIGALELELERARRESVRVVLERRWAAGALAGYDLDGELHWGGYVRAQLAGPLELGGLVDVPARAGFITLGVTF